MECVFSLAYPEDLPFFAVNLLKEGESLVHTKVPYSSSNHGVVEEKLIFVLC